MKQVILVLLVLLAACAPPPPGPSVARSSTPAPPPLATPTDVCHIGAVTYCVQNPAVTQETIGSTICKRGWTATVRPPLKYTNDLKRHQLFQFADQHPNDPNWSLTGTEEDHRLPLELGGDPRDPMNLSPEEPASPNPKDHDEDAFKQLVCAHKLTLVVAQINFITKWLGPWPEYKQ